MSIKAAKSRNVTIALICLGFLTIPFTYNACEGGFTAYEGQTPASHLSSCKKPLKPGEVSKLGDSPGPYPSPFAKGKLFAGQQSTTKSGLQKLGAGTLSTIPAGARLVALMKNTCLKIAKVSRPNSVSVEMLGTKDISPALKVQAYGFVVNQALDFDSFNKELDGDPCVIGVGYNRAYETSSVTEVFNDSEVSRQSHLANLSLDDAYGGFYHSEWGISKTQPSVKVAVVDTGVWYPHPDLKDQMFHPFGESELWGIDSHSLGIPNTPVNYNPGDVSPISHGSHVAGIIAAQGNNNFGMVGVMPHGAEIMGVKVFSNDIFDLDEDGNSDEIVASTEDVVKGIYWAIENGVDVINLSLTRKVDAGAGGLLDDPVYEAAIVEAINNNVVVVVAAGNGSPNGVNLSEQGTMTFPAYFGSKYPGVITVGSYDIQNGERSSFSHHSTSFVEIGAPGSHGGAGGIFSTHGTDEKIFSTLSGTSQAAPMVAGAVALTIGLIKANYNGLKPSPAELERLVVEGSLISSSLSSQFKDGRRLDLLSVLTNLNKQYPATKNSSKESQLPGCL